MSIESTTRDAIEEVLELIDVFEARCVEREHTDVGEAWELLEQIRVHLIRAHEREEPLPTNVKRNELEARCGEGDAQVTLVIHDSPLRVETLGAFTSETDADAFAFAFAQERGFSSIEDYNERSGHTIDMPCVPIR